MQHTEDRRSFRSKLENFILMSVDVEVDDLLKAAGVSGSWGPKDHSHYLLRSKYSTARPSIKRRTRTHWAYSTLTSNHWPFPVEIASVSRFFPQGKSHAREDEWSMLGIGTRHPRTRKLFIATNRDICSNAQCDTFTGFQCTGTTLFKLSLKLSLTYHGVIVYRKFYDQYHPTLYLINLDSSYAPLLTQVVKSGSIYSVFAYTLTSLAQVLEFYGENRIGGLFVSNKSGLVGSFFMRFQLYADPWDAYDQCLRLKTSSGVIVWMEWA
jgi:hypothetical protein